MLKAIIVTSDNKAYEQFLRTYGLKQEEYPVVHRGLAILGYKDIPALFIYKYWDVDSMDVLEYMRQHNIDKVVLA